MNPFGSMTYGPLQAPTVNHSVRPANGSGTIVPAQRPGITDGELLKSVLLGKESIDKAKAEQLVKLLYTPPPPTVPQVLNKLQTEIGREVLLKEIALWLGVNPDDPLRQWHGGSCPVPTDTLVSIKMRGDCTDRMSTPIRA